MDKISFCLTTYNRLDFTLRSFSDIYHDERIGEIVIVDDCSDMEIYLQMVSSVSELDKVKLFRNDVNLGCYHNKYKAVSHATNEYCIIADSDNIFYPDYLDAIYMYAWLPSTAFCPTFAKPLFDYNSLAGHVINKSNVSKYANDNCFAAAINTMNYFVNRDEFLKVFDKSTTKYADDSAYINYKWIEAGNNLFFVPFLQYFHTVHDKSHYLQYAKESQQRFDELMNKFKNGF